MSNKYIVVNKPIMDVEEIKDHEEQSIIIKTPRISDKAYLKDSKEFYIINNDAIEMLTALGLKPSVQLIYICLLRQNNHNDKCFISAERLASITGMTTRSVFNDLKALQDVGLIVVKVKGGIYANKKVANEYKVRYIYCQKDYEDIKE